MAVITLDAEKNTVTVLVEKNRSCTQCEKQRG